MTYTKQKYKIKAKKPYLFIGSKIRGIFGYALKEEVCINPSFKCKGCFAQKECLFYKLYEEQNITHQYRLDYKLYDDEYKFSLLLFGGLQNHNEIIKKAMMEALKFYENVALKEKIKTLKVKKYPSVIKLELLTPLRIKKQNRFAIRDIELLDILLSIHKRDLELQKLPLKRINIDTNYKIVSKNLKYKDLVRKSNHQNTKMNLGGLMGEMIISNVTKEIYDLLKIGEIIGVGKSCTFGLGKIKIEGLD